MKDLSAASDSKQTCGGGGKAHLLLGLWIAETASVLGFSVHNVPKKKKELVSNRKIQYVTSCMQYLPHGTDLLCFQQCDFPSSVNK